MSKRITTHLLAASAAALTTTGAAYAQLSPEWITTTPVGSALTAGLQGMVTDAKGVTYMTGITGPSSNTDIITVAINPDGTVLWSDIFNGREDWHDQARGIALGPNGVVYVTGNTPGTGKYANVLLLKYDAASGVLLNTVQYSTGLFNSEHGSVVAADASGNVYVGGGTNGDGPDTMLLKFNGEGQLMWKKTWDGPAASPYSQDSVQGIAMDPAGNPILLISGVMSSLHPDYVVIKYDANDGGTIWEQNWGVSGGDYPKEIELDAAGDVYVTGAGINISTRFSTIKLRGSDGQLLWQEYDGVDYHNAVAAIALDDKGGVYITGQVDPDGDRSNANADYYTVRRDAQTGALSWVHRYGASCLRCGDVPGDLIVDSEDHLMVIGRTSSPPYNGEMILFVLDANRGDELDRGLIGGGPNEFASGYLLRMDAAENIYVGGGYSNFNTGAEGMSAFKYTSLVDGCYPDCDQSTGAGVLDVFDFLCFQNSFVNGELYACDCDTSTGPGVCDIFDLLCFQDAFVAGCP